MTTILASDLGAAGVTRGTQRWLLQRDPAGHHGCDVRGGQGRNTGVASRAGCRYHRKGARRRCCDARRPAGSPPVIGVAHSGQRALWMPTATVGAHAGRRALGHQHQ